MIEQLDLGRGASIQVLELPGADILSRFLISVVVLYWQEAWVWNMMDSGLMNIISLCRILTAEESYILRVSWRYGPV